MADGLGGLGGLGGQPPDPESDAALDDLLVKVQRIEFLAMREKLKAIVACADLYITRVRNYNLGLRDPRDEALVHMEEIRREALTLLDQCSVKGWVAGLNPDRDRYASLCSLVEFAFALRAPQRVEDVHAAL